jgi:hypothetical protein
MESADNQKETYLLKGKEADIEARKATNPKVKEAWHKIADDYRALARALEPPI